MLIQPHDDRNHQQGNASETPLVVILIDDNEDHLGLLERALKTNPEDAMIGYSRMVISFKDAAEAVANLPAEGPVAIICDHNMPGGSGIDWLPDLVGIGLGPVIITTAQGDERIAAKAFKAGAYDYLVKGEVFQNPRLIHTSIRDALRRFRLETRNRELSCQLKIANASLEKKNRLLEVLTDTAHRFVDDVAHEFRTPLTVIKEFASIIDDGLAGPVSDKQTEFLQYIDTATRDLSQMIDDFLDTSKLRARTLRVDRRPHRVDEVIEKLRPLISIRAKPKRIRIVEQVEDHLPMIFCDADKVGRSLINLVVNAIKVSPEGGIITLWARRHEHAGVQIGVTDSGPGIEPKEIDKLCDRFRQVAGTERSSIKGFGLGLSIVKDLVWLNLGKMSVNSVPGEGSTFAFTLPPWDPAFIVNNYMDRLSTQENLFGLTVIQVATPDDGRHGMLLRRFLVDHCQSMDLVLASVDGRSAVLCGISDQPENWIKKIETAWSTHHADSPTDRLPDSIDVRWIGTWTQPQLKTAAAEAATGRIAGARISA